MRDSEKKEIFIKNLLYDAVFVLFVVVLDGVDFYTKLSNPFRDSISSLIEFLCNNPPYFVGVGIILLVVLASMVILYWRNISKNFLDGNFNRWDSFIANLCIVAVVLIVWFTCAYGLSYKTNVCVLTAFILATIIVIRIIIRMECKKRLGESDVITLADLYNGRIPNKSKFVLVEDSESEEDIYGRDAIIEKVLNVMRSKNNNSSFTMSLVGPWGSGKSTILKCARERLFSDDNAKKIIIIDDFEPWLYDDSETMAKEFSALLFNKLGYRLSSRMIRNFAKQFLGVVSEIKPFTLLKYLLIKEKEADPTKIINSYLTGHDIKLIIIIDNFERCKTKLMVDFLKMIKRGLNFKNTLYILSYDSEIMDEILKNNKINKKYLEKFSQMTVVVPRIDDQKNKEVTTRCFENYLKQIGEDPKEYRELINHIVTSIETPRKLLLAVNSVYAGKNKYVNPIDSIILNILKRETPTLYSLIEQNEHRFIHNESIMRADMINSDNDRKTIKQYCEGERDFFLNALRDESLRNEVVSHRELIRYIFPNISFFFSDGIDYDLYTRFNNKKETILKARKERRLRSPNFFSAYFTGVKNDYIEAADIVDTFIKNQTEEACIKLLNSLLDQKTIIQSYVLQQINERMDELKNEAVLASSIAIIDFSKFSGSAQPLFLSVRDELYILLSELIKRVDEATFEKIRKTLMSNYGNFRLIYALNYWMKDENEANEGRRERYIAIKNDFEKMKNIIIQKRINLYGLKYYQHFVVHRLGEKEAIVKYLQSIKDKVPKKRQILILADCVYQGYSSNNEYFYEIDHSILDKVYSKNEMLDIIKKARDSELKSVIKEIVEGEEDTLQGSALDSKTYHCKENYDLDRIIIEYTKKLDDKVKMEPMHEGM